MLKTMATWRWQASAATNQEDFLPVRSKEVAARSVCTETLHSRAPPCTHACKLSARNLNKLGGGAAREQSSTTKSHLLTWTMNSDDVGDAITSCCSRAPC